ncbi:DUF4244 domain-containing protein [Dietzia psychralcaliphila]|uniref:DUF4244 domain-containing protein n=1 Tax=Dietzia psychralcaliphila TaxID=139021 RepID=UPI000D300CC9|nr:DUF4244 domain-containing protein [Dietzia psychralcaliphila]PTM84816.1 uncharacterized protein DUF4244 [Dietzia psychralcaliphila]
MNMHHNSRIASTTHSSLIHRARAALTRRFATIAGRDAGMSTVEYAVGTIAAAAFGAVLYTVVSGDSIPDALGGIIEQALNTSV